MQILFITYYQINAHKVVQITTYIQKKQSQFRQHINVQYLFITIHIHVMIHMLRVHMFYVHFYIMSMYS